MKVRNVTVILGFSVSLQGPLKSLKLSCWKIWALKLEKEWKNDFKSPREVLYITVALGKPNLGPLGSRSSTSDSNQVSLV